LAAETRTNIDPDSWRLSALEKLYSELGAVDAGTDTMSTAAEVSAEIMATLDEPADEADRLTTGLPTLDAQIGGLRAGGVHLIAARPGVGKSAVAMQLAASVAEAGRAVIVFTLEMSKDDLLSRTLASFSGVNHTNIDKRAVPREQVRDLRLAHARLSKLPIVIDDCSTQTVGSMRALVRRAETRLGRSIGLVVVDYVQLVKGSRNWRSKSEELTEVGNGLLELAKDLGIPVLACAQLNRESERLTRDGKPSRPELWHLADCGGLERVARTVIMLYREEKELVAGPVEFLVRKCRQGGRVGTCVFHWDGPTMTVSERPPPGPDEYDSSFDSNLYGAY
jgi:replicative DNA helicase